MPRLRRTTPFDGKVPVELTDSNHAVWATASSAQRWIDQHELSADERVEYGPLNRCHMAGEAWSRAAGIVRDVSWSLTPALDLVRMREMGIRAGTHWSGLGRERFEYGGIVAFGGDRATDA